MSSGLQITELEFSPYLALIYTGVIATAVVAASAAIVRLSNGARSLLLPPIQRTGSLDGLRGILALAVMIHHSFTAYGYFMRGQWIWSSSSIFNQLGQSSVAMFFMITGFLF